MNDGGLSRIVGVSQRVRLIATVNSLLERIMSGEGVSEEYQQLGEWVSLPLPILFAA